MRKAALTYLQAAIVVLGVVALGFLLGEPHLEGRNAGATLAEVYLGDPFLAYAYAGAVPFFVALWQSFALLGVMRRGQASVSRAVRALRIIRRCAFAIIGFVAFGELLILLNPGDELGPPLLMGLIVSAGALTAAAASVVLESLIREPLAA